MTTHYKGQRITDLLNQVAEAEQKLDSMGDIPLTGELALNLAQAYTTIAIAKAKLTALQGEKR